MFMSILFVFALLILSAKSDDYFTQLEQLLKHEQAKLATDALHNEFASDKPKEIEIICPEVIE